MRVHVGEHEYVCVLAGVRLGSHACVYAFLFWRAFTVGCALRTTKQDMLN